MVSFQQIAQTEALDAMSSTLASVYVHGVGVPVYVSGVGAVVGTVVYWCSVVAVVYALWV